MDTPLKVIVRIRPEPASSSPSHPPSSILLNPDKKSLTLRTIPGTSNSSSHSPTKPFTSITPPSPFSSLPPTPPTSTSHTFDHIYDPSSPTSSIYSQHVSPLVDDVLDGYPATVFAYGHTGSGKTHTMSGQPSDEGIIPQAVKQIFRGIASLTPSPDPQAGPAPGTSPSGEVIFLVKICYVELYNNVFRDLLVGFDNGKEKKDNEKGNPNSNSNSNPNNDIKIRSHPTSGVFLSVPPSSPQLHHPTTTAAHALSLISFGSQNRSFRSTGCNDISSRSHTILTFTVESQLRSGTTTRELRLGRLHLVDLAGSERLSSSKVTAKSGGLQETKSINLSLAALGNVLSALSHNAVLSKSKSTNTTTPSSTQSQPMQVPYRDSKLTHLLKDSLGGNSKTLMIATVRSGGNWASQTHLSLMYAARAKNIVTKSRVNRDVYGSTDNVENTGRGCGDTGGQSLATISRDIDKLRNRLQSRETEFQTLTSMSGMTIEEVSFHESLSE